MRKQDKRIYEFGPFRLDSVERCLFRGTDPVPLTAKVFNLLLFLVENAGRLVTKVELMNAMWPDSFVEDNNLTVNMSTLRKLLGEGHERNSFIKTISGSGYRFTARVRTVGSTRVGHLNEQRDKVGVSLAVLPFVNGSADPDMEYLSDGITESITNSLSRLPQLKVLARSTVFAYKGHYADAQTLGIKMGVRTVLIGRMFEANGNMHVGLELVDVTDGSLVWSAQYKYVLKEILELQDRIVRDVVEELRLKLTGAQGEQLYKRYTESIKAYQFYLKGRHSWNKRTEAGFRQALKFFGRALEEDENYALAHVGIADCYILLAGYGYISPQASILRIKSALGRALELDENLAEAHATLGHFKTMYEWDWQCADREYQLAIKLNPNYATARHWYGLSLRWRGLFDRAYEELKHAQQLDPLSPIIDTAIGVSFYLARQPDKAITHLVATLELHPNFYVASAMLGLTYLEKGMYDKAVVELSKAADLLENPEALGMLGYAYAVSGQVRKARQILTKLKKLSETRRVDPFHIGVIHLGLEEKDQAFRKLVEAFNAKSPTMTLLKLYPPLDNLRDDPRFAELLLKTGHITIQ